MRFLYMATRTGDEIRTKGARTHRGRTQRTAAPLAQASGSSSTPTAEVCGCGCAGPDEAQRDILAKLYAGAQTCC